MHELELQPQNSIKDNLKELDFVKDPKLDKCVASGFDEYEGDPEFEKKTQVQKLGFLYGICRQKAKK